MATRTERRRAAHERRREFARRSVTAQVAARRRRSRIRWSVAAAGVAVIGVVAIVLVASRDDGGIPNVTLTGKKVDAEGALGVTAPLSAYTIDYELTSYSADPENPTKGTEQIRVSRPFGSRLTFTDATGTSSTYTSVLGKREVVDQGTTTVTAAPAAAGLYDWRFDATLDDLVASGKYTMEERREVAGRECQVYRTGSAAEDRAITDATATDYAQLCIDASGLVLEELLYVSGRPAQHVKATAVSEDPVDDIAVEGEPADTTTSFTDIGTEAEPVDGYWTLSTVPDGYELVGRYAYTVPGQVTADSTTDTTVPADTTAAPTATTTPPASSTADTTAPGSTAPDTTSAAQGFAGSNVIAAAPSSTEAATTSTAAAGEDTTTVPAEPTTTTAAPAAPPVTTYFDVYRNGDDYLIVHQGPTSEEPAASGASTETTIDGLGAVTASSGADGSTILAHPTAPADWFVAITASMDVAGLTPIAGTLAS
jgi:hypothetical protein